MIEIFMPDGSDEKTALSRTTHLCIASHQDDIELMAYDGILKCYESKEYYFTGVVATNGCGSPRNDIYADCKDDEMKIIRKKEQKKAAIAGDYSAILFLDYTSSVVKSKDGNDVIENFKKIIIETKPEYIYTHNLADKHDTHVAVAVKLIKALRELNYMPKGFYGCEVWRNLDWLNDSDKVKFDVSGRPNLINALLGVFDSQISGGKRYDLATKGRWLANATYSESHNVDKTDALMFAMDMIPLLENKELDMSEFVLEHIKNFALDVRERIKSKE